MTGNASTRAVGTEAAGRSEPKSPTPMGGASVSEVLAAAADLLEKPGAWTQGWYARDERGGICSAGASDAICFCAVGAISKVSGGLPPVQALDLMRSAAGCTDNIGDWNDAPERTQAEVVTALRQAARQASNPTAEGV